MKWRATTSGDGERQRNSEGRARAPKRFTFGRPTSRPVAIELHPSRECEGKCWWNVWTTKRGKMLTKMLDRKRFHVETWHWRANNTNNRTRKYSFILGCFKYHQLIFCTFCSLPLIFLFLRLISSRLKKCIVNESIDLIDRTADVEENGRTEVANVRVFYLTQMLEKCQGASAIGRNRHRQEVNCIAVYTGD